MHFTCVIFLVMNILLTLQITAAKGIIGNIHTCTLHKNIVNYKASITFFYYHIITFLNYHQE